MGVIEIQDGSFAQTKWEMDPDGSTLKNILIEISIGD